MGVCLSKNGAKYVSEVSPEAGAGKSPEKSKEKGLSEQAQEQLEFSERCLATVGKLSSTAKELASYVSSEVQRMDQEVCKIRLDLEITALLDKITSGCDVYDLEKNQLRAIQAERSTTEKDEVLITIIKSSEEDEEKVISWKKLKFDPEKRSISDTTMRAAKDKARKFCPAYVTESFEADPNTPQSQQISVTAGECLDILYRHYGGWTFCRKNGQEGWVPQANLEERAILREPIHAEEESQLSGNIGDTIEVKVRHYSGWSFCVHKTTGKQGWVAEHQLADFTEGNESQEEEDMNSREFSLAIKRYRQVLEALQRVMDSCQNAKGSFTWMKKASSLDLNSGIKEDGLNQALQKLVEGLSEEVIAISEVLYGGEATTLNAIVKWQWNEQEGSLVVAVNETIEVMDRNVGQSGWSWAKYNDTEGWVPDAALRYDDDPDRSDSKDSTAVDASSLPKWVKVDANAWWWSNSQSKYLGVTVTEVDTEAMKVTVVFDCNAKSWKAVAFSELIGDAAASCNLQPSQEDMEDEEDEGYEEEQAQAEVIDDLGDVLGEIKEMFGGDDTDLGTITGDYVSDMSDSSFSDDDSDEGKKDAMVFETASRPLSAFSKKTVQTAQAEDGTAKEVSEKGLPSEITSEIPVSPISKLEPETSEVPASVPQSVPSVSPRSGAPITEEPISETGDIPTEAEEAQATEVPQEAEAASVAEPTPAEEPVPSKESVPAVDPPQEAEPVASPEAPPETEVVPSAEPSEEKQISKASSQKEEAPAEEAPSVPVPVAPEEPLSPEGRLRIDDLVKANPDKENIENLFLDPPSEEKKLSKDVTGVVDTLFEEPQKEIIAETAIEANIVADAPAREASKEEPVREASKEEPVTEAAQEEPTIEAQKEESVVETSAAKEEVVVPESKVEEPVTESAAPPTEVPVQSEPVTVDPQVDEERRAEEERLRKEEEAKAAAARLEEARIKSEADATAEAARLAEEARKKAEEDAAAEAARLAEEQRLAEEAKKKAEEEAAAKAKLEKETKASLVLSPVLRTFHCQQQIQSIEEAHAAIAIQKRVKGRAAKDYTQKLRQKREDELLEKIFQQLSKVEPSMELIEKLERIEERREKKGDKIDNNANAKLATACAAASEAMNAKFDAAFEMKLRLLDEEFASKETGEKKKLEDVLASRTKVCEATGKDMTDILKWHQDEMELIAKETEALLKVRKNNLIMQKQRLRAQHQLSDVIQNGSQEEVVKARKAIFDSSMVLEPGELFDNLSCEHAMIEVANWARLLPEETQWGRTTEERKQKNEVFEKQLHGLLDGLVKRLQRDVEKHRTIDQMRDDQGWDDDMRMAKLTAKERKSRKEYILQQNIEREKRVDKDCEMHKDRGKNRDTYTIKDSNAHVDKRLEERFLTSLQSAYESLAGISDGMCEIDDEYDNYVSSKESELEEELAKFIEERSAKQELNRQIHMATIDLQKEKERMMSVKDSSNKKIKRNGLKRALKGVKKLKRKFRGMDVDTNNKQKVSVLLYSLRMIETQLRKELGSKDCDQLDKNEEEGIEDEEDNEKDKKDDLPESDTIKKRKQEWQVVEETFVKTLERDKEKMKKNMVEEFEKAALLKKCKDQEKIVNNYKPKVKEAEELMDLVDKEMERIITGIKLVPVACSTHSFLEGETRRITDRKEKGLAIGRQGLPTCAENVSQFATKIKRITEQGAQFTEPKEFKSARESVVNRIQSSHALLDSLSEATDTRIQLEKELQEKIEREEAAKAEAEAKAAAAAEAAEKDPTLTNSMQLGAVPEQKSGSSQVAKATPPSAKPSAPKASGRGAPKSAPKSAPKAAPKPAPKAIPSKSSDSGGPPRRQSLAGSSANKLLNDLDDKVDALNNIMKKAKAGGQKAPPPVAKASPGGPAAKKKPEANASRK